MTSLRVRLLAGLLAALTLAALVVGGVTYRNVLRDTQELFDYQLRQMALTLREQGGVGSEQAQALSDEDLDFVVQIWTVDGRSIFATRRHEALPSRAVLGFADVAVPGGGTWRTYSVVTPSRVIQVAQPLQIRQRLAAEAAFRGVVPLLVLVPLLGGAVWWLVAVSLAPLRRVAGEVRRRDANALAPVESEGLPEEVAPLVQSLNALLARLSDSFDAQRAFVADAAHELRSPLTALKLQIDVLRRAPDDASRATALASLNDGVDRAARLVDQLLTLARSESSLAGKQFQELSLGEVARDALAATVPYAVSREVELTLDGDDNVTVRGDRAALSAMIRNLVDNAVRYGRRASAAPPVRDWSGKTQAARSPVRVSVDRDAHGAARLYVDDAGPGIPVADRERVFDRFYRREMPPGGQSGVLAGGADEGGTGLGLAIVKNVARQHGADVRLSDSPLGGLRVEVRFPEVAS